MMLKYSRCVCNFNNWHFTLFYFQILLSSISQKFHSVTLEMNKNSHFASSENVTDDDRNKIMGHYFGEIYLILPNSWASQPDCLHGRNVTQTGSKILFNKIRKYHPDFILESPHPIFGSEPWSNQFGGCTVQGHGVAVPYTFLTNLGGVQQDTVPINSMERTKKYATAGNLKT